MSDKLIGGRYYPEIDGSLIAGPSWKNFIQRVPGQYEANPFAAAPANIVGQAPAPRPVAQFSCPQPGQQPEQR